MLVTTGALLAVGALVAGCSSGSAGDSTQPTNASVEGNTEEGETVVVGFSGPAADHGWLGAINAAATAEAEQYGDIDFRVAEGTNDANLQISQIETFINDEVDAIVPAAAAMFTEEIGYAPYVGSAAAYRAGVQRLVMGGRTFVLMDGARVRFKADVGSLASGVAQIQGV